MKKVCMDEVVENMVTKRKFLAVLFLNSYEMMEFNHTSKERVIYAF